MNRADDLLAQARERLRELEETDADDVDETPEETEHEQEQPAEGSNPVTAQPQASDPQPFFEDTRTISEKLASDERQWKPHEGENCPNTLFGLVLERGTFTSNYDNRDVPTLQILAADGTVWSVTAFHGYLAGAIKRKNPRAGDFVAIAYKGKGKAKEGESEPYLYQLEVERNPDRPEPAPAADSQPADAGTSFGDDDEWQSRLASEPDFDDEASASW
jgi:hypothetical protein